MDFIRRHFYDLTTGETLQSYSMEGDISPGTVEQDAEVYGLSNYGYFEWLEKDEEVEANFANSYGRVTVDVAAEPPVLVFDLSPLPEPEEIPDYAGYYEAMTDTIEGGTA